MNYNYWENLIESQRQERRAKIWANIIKWSFLLVVVGLLTYLHFKGFTFS